MIPLYRRAPDPAIRHRFLRAVIDRVGAMSTSTSVIVSFGEDLELSIPAGKNDNLIPRSNANWFGTASDELPMPKEIFGHLRWMAQKYRLGQDMYLVGQPSSFRRALVMKFAEECGLEVEYLSITRDTTESDLKQRREIVGSTARFVDQPPVRAALHGRLLILDGVEQAERNVLPTLNNLLENREMNLEDGRMLLLKSKIDAIAAAGTDGNLVAVHPNFRVVALGLPVPPFAGRTLDPPLRSRFQSRFVDEPTAETVVELVSGSFPGGVDDKHLGKLLSFYETLRTLRRDTILSGRTGGMGSASMHSVPIFSVDAFRTVARQLRPPASSSADGGKISVPNLATLVERVCPSTGWMAHAATDQVIKSAVAEASQRLAAKTTGAARAEETNSRWGFSNIFSSKPGYDDRAKKEAGSPPDTSSRLLPHQAELFSDMLSVADSGARHFCLFGARGSGKSRIVIEFAARMGSSLRTFPMYQELASRDLLQRRVTVSDNSSSSEATATLTLQTNTGGDIDAASETTYTSWKDSPLVTAARNGHVCVLDGVDRLDAHCLFPLKRLLHEGVLDLPSGELLRAHPNFHLVMLAESPMNGTATSREMQMRYVSSDLSVQYLFLKDFSVFSGLPQLLHNYSRAEGTESRTIASEKVERILISGGVESPVERSFASIRSVLQDLENSGMPELRLTLRRANRVITTLTAECAVDAVANAAGSGSVRALIEHVYNAQLLTGKATATFVQVLDRAFGAAEAKATDSKALKGKGASPVAPQVGKGEAKADAAPNCSVELRYEGDYLQIGSVSAKKNVPAFPAKVPHTLFYPNDSQLLSMQKLLRDYVRKEKAVLLIGNQGVGKNKIVDKFLEFMRLEREYVQLHRDTTLSSLTSLPSLQDGKIVFEDSPLVRAAKMGRVFVVDEADKAPLEVSCCLKGLVEDGELILGDGRRLISQERWVAEGSTVADDHIVMHPDFFLIVLGNLPGFPFLGNEIFKTIGDVFSTHVIENLDILSEIQLLRQYGPCVPLETLQRLALAFVDLRALHKEGAIAYPFSARECVSIVKHLEHYPADGVVSAVENILAFDALSPELRTTIVDVFRTHGFPLTSSYRADNGPLLSSRAVITKRRVAADDTKGSEPRTGPDKPKHGKEDPDNKPHVGGNTWAGGTGGSDTAGLGGRGGPYRLDKGHEVHQVSDEAKAEVSDKAREMARLLAKEGLEKRLKEIKMGEGDFEIYQHYRANIAAQRSLLKSLFQEFCRRQKERTWLKGQAYGELDDSRLVDGLAGERLVFKRRGMAEASFSPHQSAAGGDEALKKKHFKFVVDCSGSMYRFNGLDRRLERMLETVLLLMESLPGGGGVGEDGGEAMADLISYSVVGHSGDSPAIDLGLGFGDAKPQNEREQFSVLERIVTHTQFCQSGDYTLEATDRAIDAIVEEAAAIDGGCDDVDKVVIVLSDANFKRYGISSKKLAAVMRKDPSVVVHFILIASLRDEASDIQKQLPSGKSHVCSDSSDLPVLFRHILSDVMLTQK